MLFADRGDAGRRLAGELRALAGQDVVVVGLSRGGLAVGFEVAQALGAPLDIIIVPGLGAGPAGEGGVHVTSADIIGLAGVNERALGSLDRTEPAELERVARQFRGQRAAVPLAGRTVVVVDDGITTGWTARMACRIVRARGAARVVFAAPVGPHGVEQRIAPDTDEVVSLHTQAAFFTIGECYADPEPTTDLQVAALLRRASWERGPGADPAAGPASPAGRR